MRKGPKLSVRIAGDRMAFEGSPTGVMVEVRGPRRTLLDRRMVTINAPRATRMRLGEPGPYAVRATLGSGAVLDEYFDFDGEDSPRVDFGLWDQSPHESLQRVATVRPILGRPARALTASPYLSAWVRLWERVGGKWTPVSAPLDAGKCEWHDDAVRYRLELGRRQYVLQVGAPGIPAIMTALPATGATDVVVQPVSLPDGRPRFKLSVVPVSDDAATLLGYVGRGDVRAVESMAATSERTAELLRGDSPLEDEELAPNDAVVAEMLLYRKVADPNSAALGGYHLLRIGELERLHSWPANLANWMSWMSDGPIIRGWQLLHGARPRSGETARRRFLEAVERGLPIYSEGLRLLIDGLKVLSHADPDDGELAGAVDSMGMYAAAADWSQPVLTFHAGDPMTPGRGHLPTHGAGAEATLMLYSITTEDLVAHRLLRPGAVLTVPAEYVESLKERASDWTYPTAFGKAEVDPTGSVMTERSVSSVDDPDRALVEAGLWPWDGWQAWSRPDGVSLDKLRDMARRYPPDEAEALAIPILETSIPARAAQALADAGLVLLAELKEMRPEELQNIGGIGPRRAAQVIAALEKRGVPMRGSERQV